jgi:pathogenesis-related protein 1
MKHVRKLTLLLLSFVFITCTSDDTDSPVEGDVIQQFLDAHNAYRREVGIDDLVWSEDLAVSSKQWAETLAIDCGFEHSTGPHGENLWKGTSNAFSIQEVVDLWGSEKANYHYEDNSCDEGKVCGHYTQIVWANTTEVGCGVSSCHGKDIWVCQYLPPGNFNNEKPY